MGFYRRFCRVAVDRAGDDGPKPTDTSLGGFAQSIESGVDYPWLLFQLVTTGKLDESVEGVVGTRTQVPVMGVLSAMRDVDLEKLQEMQQQGDAGWERMKDGDVGKGLSMIAKGLAKGLDVPDRIKQLQQFLQENKNARTEILSTEDPQAALGILYGFASVLHSGKLPEQFRR